MSPSESRAIERLALQQYEFGFVTPVEQDTIPPGLDEDVVRLISAKKQEPGWLLEWRLAALRHWQGMKEPRWANLTYPAIDYQAISYYSAPRQTPRSLDEVDPEIRRTYDRLGIPLEEQAALSGVAVDAVFDSVSVPWESSSVPSQRPFASTLVWYASIWDLWYRLPTTTLPR